MPKLAINIDVDDIERGIAFYTSAFGLRLARRLSPEIAELAGMPSPIFLLQKPAGSSPAPEASGTRNYARHWTPVHLDFLTRDVYAAAERAERAGARREGSIEVYDWGKIAYFSDPFGHGFCLLQYPESAPAAVGE